MNKIASEIVIDDDYVNNHDHMIDYNTFDSDFYYNDHQFNASASRIVVYNVNDDLVSLNYYHLG